MSDLNHDDFTSQSVLKWFNQGDLSIIKSSLAEIAKSNAGLDTLFLENYSPSERKLLCSSNKDSSRVIVLLEIIRGLINPFLANSKIGNDFRQRANLIFQDFDINTSTYKSRLIEVDESILKHLFNIDI